MTQLLSLARVAAIARREWQDLRRNKSLLASAVLVPFFFSSMAAVLGTMAERAPAGAIVPRDKMPPWMSGEFTARELTASLLANLVMMLFLLMPTTLPSIMAAHSIVGEKVTRTLEPLLATPVRTFELVLGKVLTFAAIGALPSYAGLALYVGIMAAATSPDVFALMCAPRVLVGIVVLAPPMSVLAVCFGMLVSTRANDVQSAQAWAGVVVLPLIGLMLSQLFGAMKVTVLGAFAGALAVSVLDFGLLLLCASVFERETILTRWR